MKASPHNKQEVDEFGSRMFSISRQRHPEGHLLASVTEQIEKQDQPAGHQDDVREVHQLCRPGLKPWVGYSHNCRSDLMANAPNDLREETKLLLEVLISSF